MLKMLDIVKLKEDDQEAGIRNDMIGTVVYIHDNGEAYTVEFVDDNGNTIEASLLKEYTEDQLLPAK